MTVATQTIRRFTWAQDDDSGMWGWKLKGMPHFNAFSRPIGILHDTMEHLNPAAEVIDTFADEMQALGSMLYLRVEPCFMPPDERVSRPIEPYDLARDLVDCVQQHYEGGTAPEDIGRLKTKRPTRFRMGAMDDFLEDALHRARLLMPGELDAGSTTQLPTDLQQEWPALARRMAHWIRTGYRRFMRRWHDDVNLATNVAYSLCVELKRKADYMTSLWGEGEGSAGAELTIRFRPGTPELAIDIQIDGRSLDDM